MLSVTKRRVVILASCSFLAFIIGCTITISLVSLDNCGETQRTDVHKYLNTIYSSSFKSERKLLTVLILTSPVNINRRNVIRQTWLSLCNFTCSIRHYFVIGSNNLPREVDSSIQEEQLHHHDLLLLPNVVDNYTNLTHKVLEAYVWLDKIGTYEFVLKCDDDSFVQIDKIVLELQKLPQPKRQGLYWGFFNGKAHIKEKGKWRESSWVLCDYYLPYALGGGYILSQRLVHFIASNAQYLRLYNSEDVSVGVWLAPVADINRQHDPRFDTEFVSRGCSNSYLITHKHDENAMMKMFSTLKKTGKLCIKEYKYRKSYIYNWNLPPSRCCMRNDSSIP
ncbi:Beta-1 [Blattella germanica]|nr:Beta-1 [Blattella germanica]